MSSSNYPTLSISVPLYHMLLKMLKETQQMNNIPQCLMQGCEAATSKLLNYCHKTNIFHLAAIVLDPRLKFNYFEELGWSLILISQIKKIIRDKYESQYISVSSQDIEDSIAEPFATNIISRIYKRAHVERQSELDTYSMMPRADPQIDVLEWWRVNEACYSNLAKFARNCLAIPATSIPSKQIFSVSGDMITDKRNKLAEKTV
ncbi:12995_t:CDS:2 [Ambispora leptoticha]|uniref:12995_t:CDS:1 n=1 Tax=Ambispora leptoticha TaxID=144679 RepID=A0A9N9G1C1_9GLOM|nr:12995_t:CDS:2 [Ambispora leptoticha]